MSFSATAAPSIPGRAIALGNAASFSQSIRVRRIAGSGTKRTAVIAPRQGLFDITSDVLDWLATVGPGASGLLTLFCRHTSASLLVQENASPDAHRDLERWLRRIAPENEAYEHSLEGPDDMPAHLRAALTATQLTIALTKSLGKELAGTGVLVNAITPAAARTPIFDQMTQQHIDYMLSKIPMNRFLEPAEAAALVAWLASEDCAFSTGAVFDISGGRATY